MQKARSNSNPVAFQSPRDATVLWHGWLKKLGRFSKRWRRRYFVFVSTTNGTKELRHYDACRDVATLLVTTPKGVITMTDAIGICCFLPTSPPTGKKPPIFNRSDGNDADLDSQDQKFAVITPLTVTLLAFHNGREWGIASEAQQGLSLLAALSAFYPAIDVLHSGWMTKKRERTVHSAKSIMSYWKRHFFVFLATGDLLYFRDESLNELQGRVDVRHAPTVRVTGERMIEEKKKETSLFKFTSKMSALERRACLVWIATPPSKMFVLKLQDDHDVAVTNGKRNELTPAAKKWLSLLLKGHAETKYTQLEKCIAASKYESTPEIISAVRAGIPDELRGQLWKGFSGAAELQRRAELKRSIRRKASKSGSMRSRDSTTEAAASDVAAPTSLFDEYALPIDPNAPQRSPENQMLYSRLRALALREAQHGNELTLPAGRLNRTESDLQDERQSMLNARRGSFSIAAHTIDVEADTDDEPDTPLAAADPRNTLKQLGKGRLGDYVYPSDSPSADWEMAARRRVLIANSRYNPYSHPCPWRMSCLLLAYLEEESVFWVVNSLNDVMLPGYFHGHRPALQIDVSAFQSLLENRAPALFSHLQSLEFPLDRLVEKWFLTIFTSTTIPLPTVLRIWDAFFSQGLRVLFGVGIALFLQAEEKLFHATTCHEVDEYLHATEISCIDANLLFSLVFKDDLNIPWLTGDQLEKLRTTHRQRVLDAVARNVEQINEKVGILTQVQDVCSRCASVADRLSGNSGVQAGNRRLAPPFYDDEDDDELGGESMDLCLRMLQLRLTDLSESASNLATELSRRQSKWLALSSQLKACPLGKLPNLDLQSWLSQVREGKVSGAGHDMSSGSSLDQLGYLSPVELIESSRMFFESESSSDSTSREQRWSCLMNAREDLKPSHIFLSEVFMYSLVSAVKATCAVRLECLGASYRYMWHGSRWIQSPMEFPPLQQKTEFTHGMPRSNHRLARSNTSAAHGQVAARQPRARDDSDIACLQSLGQDLELKSFTSTLYKQHDYLGASSFSFSGAAMLDEEEKSPSSPTFGAIADKDIYPGFHQMPAMSSPIVLNASSGSYGFGLFDGSNNKRMLDDLAFQYREGGEIFKLAHGKLMGCFAKFIRVESRNKAWELRERAFVLEEDLQQEVKDLEREILGSQWIDQF